VRDDGGVHAAGVAEICAAVRAALPRVLVAVDFDGTLAPIVPDPQDSRPAPGSVPALTALAGRGARVAVITGRDARTAVRLGGFDAVPGLVVAGLYGLETWTAGTLASPQTPASIRALRDRLPTVLREQHADPAVWIEDKRLSLVVHGRKAADPAAALDPLREPLGTLAGELGLALHPGNGVLELRLPGYDKAAALRRLAAAGEYVAVLFLGDDLGDVPAFEQVRRWRADGVAAWGVAVTAGNVPEVVAAADAHVPAPADVVDLLVAIATPS
jgi:trehalose 6-phosphate phosphatase